MKERRTDEECPPKQRGEGLKSIWGSHTSAGGVGKWEGVSIGSERRFPFQAVWLKKRKTDGVITHADVQECSVCFISRSAICLYFYSEQKALVQMQSLKILAKKGYLMYKRRRQEGAGWRAFVARLTSETRHPPFLQNRGSGRKSG